MWLLAACLVSPRISFALVTSNTMRLASTFWLRPRRTHSYFHLLAHTLGATLPVNLHSTGFCARASANLMSDRRSFAACLQVTTLNLVMSFTVNGMRSNSALLTDAFHSALRAARGAAKRGRYVARAWH